MPMPLRFLHFGSCRDKLFTRDAVIGMTDYHSITQLPTRSFIAWNRSLNPFSPRLWMDPSFPGNINIRYCWTARWSRCEKMEQKYSFEFLLIRVEKCARKRKVIPKTRTSRCTRVRSITLDLSKLRGTNKDGKMTRALEFPSFKIHTEFHNCTWAESIYP